MYTQEKKGVPRDGTPFNNLEPTSENTKITDAAKEYIKAGLRVVPCHYKRPIEKIKTPVI